MHTSAVSIIRHPVYRIISKLDLIIINFYLHQEEYIKNSNSKWITHKLCKFIAGFIDFSCSYDNYHTDRNLISMEID